MSPSVFSINTILEFLPKQRRTGLFSATQTQEVENLVRAGLRNPVRISVKEKGVAASSTQKTPSRLENHYMVSAGCLHNPNEQISLSSTPGEENVNPLQCSCLEYPMDRGAWQATVHGVAKSQTQFSD